MSDTSRRTFLAMTGAGAVAASATVLVPDALASTTRSSTDDAVTYDHHAHRTGELIVVYLHDDNGASMVINAGEHEVQITDKALAAKIRKYARGSR